MTLKNKNSRQVSLDFKKLPLNVANPIENKPLNTSFGPEDESDECTILSEEKCKSKKIDNFFKSMSKSSTCLKRKTTNEDSSDDPASKTSKLIEKMDVDQEVENESEDKENLKIAENGVPNEEDVEVMEVSSSNSEDEDDEEGEEIEEEEPDSEESNTSESENELPSCEPSGDNMAVVNSESKSDQNDSSKASNLRKKRRPSSVVEAERKEKELMRARRRVDKEAQRLEREREKERQRAAKLAKQAQKLAERAAAKQLAEKEKEEKRLKREEARREKEEKEAQALKEKEEKKQKREEERREKELAKKEERLKKEEERKKREEEKLQEKKEREEAKRLEQEREAQEEQRRLSRQAAFFSSFFRKETSGSAAESSEEIAKTAEAHQSGPFDPFQVKKDMKLAPISHLARETRHRKSQEMERAVLQNSPDPRAELYLTELRTGIRKPTRIKRKRECQSADKDIELIDPNSLPTDRQWYRVKVLQFKEDYRPPYYGTFRQRSRLITGRRPFTKDPSLRNYEIDSGEEWEEPEDGESLSNSDEEEEDALGEEGDDDNDGFFVPHGYLSEDEGVDGEEDNLTPEMRKAKQLLLQQRFEAAAMRKLQPLQNVVISPAVDPAQHPVLKQYKVIELTNEFPIPISAASVTRSASGSKTISKFGVPEDAMPDLIRLVSGNCLSMKKILFEFRMFWEQKLTGNLPNVSWEEDLKGREWEAFSISKNKLERKIREFTKREDGCWRVSPEIQAVYPIDEKPWNYVTEVMTIRKKRKSSPVKEIDTEPEAKTEKADEPDLLETPSKNKRSSIMTFFANQETEQQNKDSPAKSSLPIAKVGQQNKDIPAKCLKLVTKSGPLSKFTAVTSPFPGKTVSPNVVKTKVKASMVGKPKTKLTTSNSTHINQANAKTVPTKPPGISKPCLKKKASTNTTSKADPIVTQPGPRSHVNKCLTLGKKTPAKCDGKSSLNSVPTKLKGEDRTLQNDVEVIDLCD